jgi:hypothetical protein
MTTMPAALAGARTRVDSWSPRIQAFVATLVYAVIAIRLTWPMPAHIGSLLYGGTGDPFGGLANLRELVDHNHIPFLPGRIHDFAAPEGLPIPWVRSLASFSGQTILFSLGWTLGPLAAYNVFILAGFILSGLSGFLLARRLSGSAGGGFIAGLALAFYPYVVVKSHGHYELAHSWVLVLALWRMLELAEHPGRRNGVLAGLAVLLALTFTPYFILLGGVLYATVAVCSLVSAWRMGTLRSAIAGQAWPAGMVVLYLGLFRLLASAAESGQGLRQNGDQEFITYSARAYEYLVPNATNPIVGSETGPWLARHLHGSNGSESTLYVGLVVLALAGYATWRAVRGRVPRPQRHIVFTLVTVAIVAGLCSAPPMFQAGGLSVPMPLHFISSVSPTWRVYARMVSLIEIALVMLAALAVADLVRGRRAVVRAAVVAVIAVAVLVDFSPRNGGSNPISEPSIYQAFKGLPRGIVAEYPLVPTVQDSYDELVAQQFHGMPIVNGYESGSPSEARALTLADPSAPTTGEGLAALGVKYILIRNVPANAALKAPSSDFRLLAQNQSGRLFAVRPTGLGRTPASIASLGEGFDPPEQDPEGYHQWLTAATGEIDLRADCRHCRGELQFTATSLGGPRQVRITGGTHPVVATVVGGTSVRVPVRFHQSVTLKVSTEPGPVPAKSVIAGSTDPRLLSINLRTPRLELRP